MVHYGRPKPLRLCLRGHLGRHGLRTVLQQRQHPALGAQSHHGAGADGAKVAVAGAGSKAVGFGASWPLDPSWYDAF